MHARTHILAHVAGTGKTVYVKRHLQEGLPARFTNMLMTFSAQTSANLTQACVRVWGLWPSQATCSQATTLSGAGVFHAALRLVTSVGPCAFCSLRTVVAQHQLNIASKHVPQQCIHTAHTFQADTTLHLFKYLIQLTGVSAQDIIDGKLDKRKRGVFGPPVGKTMVIFVDDLNMPQVRHVVFGLICNDVNKQSTLFKT
jgi:hypothetical protein